MSAIPASTRILLLIVATALFAVCGAVASAITRSEIPATLQRIRASVQSFKADFQYTKNPTGLEGYQITQKGTITQKGSRLVKIEFTSPRSQVAVIRGSFATMAQRENNVRTQKRLLPDIQRLLTPNLVSLLQPLDLLDYVTLNVEGRQGKYWMVTGTARDANAPFSRIQFLLDPQDILPLFVSVYNRQGGLRQISSYRFERVGTVQVPVAISSVFPGKKSASIIEVQLENFRVNMDLSPDEFVIPF